jgi:hypothetical protein
MGKMPLRGQHWGRGRQGNTLKGGAELQQLLIRERQQKALEKDDGFAEAGVEVVVRGIEQIPFPLGLHGGGVVQRSRGITEGFVEILDEFQKGGDFVMKLRTMTEKNAAADSVEAGRAPALGLLKIIGIERAQIGDDAKMFCMNKHGAQKSQQRIGESFAKSWSNRKGLMCLAEPADTAKSEGFVQIDTEHGVRRFKAAQRVEVRSGFLCGEWRSPILRDRAGARGRKSESHCGPPRGRVEKFGEYNKTFKNR